MKNPWEEISLEDYENHMCLESVMQLQTMNVIMKNQFEKYPVTSAMILGIAGGNGVEHINRSKYKAVYGIDINEEYLKTVAERYSDFSDVLTCMKIDLNNETEKLPHADLIIANLLVEYIGYEVFKKSVLKANPEYVSCVIQINTDEKQWVSDSPYLHAFDRLDEVHHQMEEKALSDSMKEIGYSLIFQESKALPNGKALVRLDFQRS